MINSPTFALEERKRRGTVVVVVVSLCGQCSCLHACCVGILSVLLYWLQLVCVLPEDFTVIERMIYKLSSVVKAKTDLLPTKHLLILCVASELQGINLGGLWGRRGGYRHNSPNASPSTRYQGFASPP